MKAENWPYTTQPERRVVRAGVSPMNPKVKWALHRYTITSEGASPGYFRLVEDSTGAWMQTAEVLAALRDLQAEHEKAVSIIEAIIYASDGCQGHRECNHSMEPWQRARALLADREIR